MSKSTISTFQLFEMFPDQETARTYLESRLWPEGPKCPVCGLGERITARAGGFYRFNQCKEDFTVRTGTIFERSHVPLHKWIYAMYLLVTARKGISSLQLSKQIGITQKSAWFVLHRLREACGGDLEKLQGIVEIDETYVGGIEKNKHESKKLKAGRGTVGKTAVVAMRERKGRMKAMAEEDRSMSDIGVIMQPFSVRAFLEGRKTMTRRHAWRTVNGDDAELFPTKWQDVKPGDRLWVREAWRGHRDHDDIPPRKLLDGSRTVVVSYAADGEGYDWLGRERRSIHMPRWASRLTLTVTATKIERIQDISEEDAIAEGIECRDGCWGTWNPDGTMRCGGSADPREAFRCLWINLHGTGAWDANPEVVALTFKVQANNIDRIAA